MADGSHHIRARPIPPRKLRATLEAALERLLSAVDAVISDLDALDGDPDLEAVCEDEGGQCDDEGSDSEREPEGPATCHWQDEGDQTVLRPHSVYVRPDRRPAQYTNVGPFIRVRAL